MKKFCINAVPKPGIVSNSERSSECIVFNTDEMKPSCHSNVIILNCKKFNVDEANSSKNWRDAFSFNEEPPQGILITVNSAYVAGSPMPYFE